MQRKGSERKCDAIGCIKRKRLFKEGRLTRIFCFVKSAKGCQGRSKRIYSEALLVCVTVIGYRVRVRVMVMVRVKAKS
jgi:hypothetical protein